MTYSPKAFPTVVPMDKPNNRAILQLKFAVDQLAGTASMANPDRSVRLGELLESGLIGVTDAGVLFLTDAALSATAPGENFIVNGSFARWSNGTGVGAVSALSRAADCWHTTCDGKGTGLSTGWSLVPGPVTPESGKVRYAMRAGWTAAASAHAGRYAAIQTYLECGERFNGRTLTVSFEARANVARDIAFDYKGGSPAGAFSAGPAQKVRITTEWRRYSVTVTDPGLWQASAAGYQFHALELTWWLIAGADWAPRAPGVNHNDIAAGWVEISAVKMELGDTATPYVLPNPGWEGVICDRYVESTYVNGIAPGTIDARGRLAFSSAAAAGQHYYGVRFRTQKLGVPAVRVYAATSTGGFLSQVAQADGSSSSAAVTNAGESGFELSWGNHSGQFGGWFHYIAEAYPW